MPISRPEAEALATLVHQLRPTWHQPGILAVLKSCAHRPEPAAVIAQAMLRATMDRDEARTPAALLARPSYWDLAKPLDYRRPQLTPEHECKTHPGQWRSTCSGCHGDAKAETPPTDPTAEPLEGYDPTAATIGQYHAEEARRIAQRNAERLRAERAAQAAAAAVVTSHPPHPAAHPTPAPPSTDVDAT